MLATATDDDLKELAELQHKPLGDSTLDEKLESLIKTLVTFFILVSVLEEVYPRESEYA